MAKAKKNINFEKALDQLEEIVEDMEGADLSLEESLKSFEKGIKLTRDCQEALTNAEQKVQTLIEKNGEFTAVELEDTEEDDFEE